MTVVFINPGSGPVSGARRRHADRNMRALCREIGVAPRFRRAGGVDGGRYGYTIEHAAGKRTLRCDVDMPGLPLERVRYMGADDQNPWHFPRLYVDGSSWLWMFAIDIARGRLGITRGET